MKKLIAMDLDGTLLNSAKTISEKTIQALQRAAEEGHWIVPCTGRFYGAMPEIVRSLPFVRYAITINGACAERTSDHEILFRADMSCEQGCEILEYLEQFPVLYDVYANNWAWTREDMWERLQTEIGPETFHKMVKDSKSPVADVKEYLRSGNYSVQKAQAYLLDTSLQAELMEKLQERFPWAIVSNSVPFNIEINLQEANKGNALRKLAEVLEIPMEDTVSFGDSTNDLTMIRAAGVGVAMGNGLPEVKEAADMITDTNDEDGIAKALEILLGWSK